ncbi:MAG: hypothetical protein FJ098_14520, partial [Deltaproteobacteria bacterium]|nr:hypothetical protein [Deltaproteobacteria bacterium]
MKFELLTPALGEVDACAGELLALPVFQVDAPPHGLAGHVDWRLHGLISRLLAERGGPGPAGFNADAGERLLLPAGHRVPFQWVVYYGLGSPRGFGMDRYRSS